MQHYQFKSNARHNLVGLWIARDMGGDGGIVSLFNANVKINEHAKLQSIRILERNAELEEVSAAIYDALDDVWCYPKWVDPKGLKVPPRAFMYLSHRIAEAVSIGMMGVQGDSNDGLEAIATGAQRQLAEYMRGQTGLLIFADPPQPLG